MVHPAKTQSRILRDNQTLVDLHGDMTSFSSDYTSTLRRFNATQAGISDFVNNRDTTPSFHVEYACEDDFNKEFMPPYKQGRSLAASCTHRQAIILYRLVVLKQSITQIAEELDITTQGVEKHISLIKNKGRKIR